jgi:putative N6-adenine-specific DNA methylase
MSATRLTLFVGVTPRLEHLLAEELRALGFELKPERVKGGVEVVATPQALWRLAHWTRLAESIRVRLGAFQAHNFDQLRKGLVKLPWSAYFPRGSAPTVEVVCKKSTLYHSDAVSEQAAAAIRDRLALAPSAASAADAPPVPPSAVHIRLIHNVAQVSVDAVGEDLLHRRGWRQHIGRAPLRETLAAALLAAAARADQADPSNLSDTEAPASTPTAPAVLWDPFCGSGTLPIEHTLRAMGWPAIPAAGRGFAFQAWPTHDALEYQTFRASLPPCALPEDLRDGPLAIGSDIDPDAVRAAHANADAAGVSALTRFVIGDFDAVAASIPLGAMVVSNLPYGQRLEDDSALIGALRRFGALLRRRADLRPVVVINGHPQLLPLTALPWQPVLSMSNRGLRVEVLSLPR